MSDNMKNDPLLESFVFETLELVSQLENIALASEEESAIGSQINEIFRIVHTIKGSSSMMDFESISSLSHSLEDVFYYLRENHPDHVDYTSLTDVVLKSTDFIRGEVNLIQSGENPNHDPSEVVQVINDFLSALKNGNERPNQIMGTGSGP